jgi:hypothetical protein
MRSRWLFLAVVAATFSGSPLSAQDRDARILEPGVIRLSVGGQDVRADAILGGGGETLPHHSHALTPDSFAPLRPLRDSFEALFAPAGFPPGVAPGDLFAGQLAFDETANTRSLPLALAIGVFPRIQLSARLPFFRSERMTRRTDVAEANVGMNPDTAANLSLLEGLPGAQLGRQPLLPIQGTPLGVALQARVGELTGGTLLLPDTPLTAAELIALGLAPPERIATLWQPGDLELGVQGQVLRSFAGSYPPDEGVNYRASAGVSLRLPTGTPVDDLWNVAGWPQVGRFGTGAGATADLFVGPRFWFSGGAEVERHSPRSPETTTVGQTGDAAGIGLWFTPRYRLTREISFGGSARVERSSIQVNTPEGWTDVSGNREWLGFSLRYTALPAFEAGTSRLPVEFTLGYLAAFRGAAGAPAERLAYVQLSMERRFWGRE